MHTREWETRSVKVKDNPAVLRVVRTCEVCAVLFAPSSFFPQVLALGGYLLCRYVPRAKEVNHNFTVTSTPVARSATQSDTVRHRARAPGPMACGG